MAIRFVTKDEAADLFQLGVEVYQSTVDDRNRLVEMLELDDCLYKYQGVKMELPGYLEGWKSFWIHEE